MLVIRRRAGESLLIGDAVEVEIVEVSGGRVKLGIRAPREVTVMRKEVRLSADENRFAAACADHLTAARRMVGYLRKAEPARSQIEIQIPSDRSDKGVAEG